MAFNGKLDRRGNVKFAFKDYKPEVITKNVKNDLKQLLVSMKTDLKEFPYKIEDGKNPLRRKYECKTCH